MWGCSFLGLLSLSSNGDRRTEASRTLTVKKVCDYREGKKDGRGRARSAGGSEFVMLCFRLMMGAERWLS